MGVVRYGAVIVAQRVDGIEKIEHLSAAALSAHLLVGADLHHGYESGERQIDRLADADSQHLAQTAIGIPDCAVRSRDRDPQRDAFDIPEQVLLAPIHCSGTPPRQMRVCYYRLS